MDKKEVISVIAVLQQEEEDGEGEGKVADDDEVMVAEMAGISKPTIASEDSCMNCMSSLYEVEDSNFFRSSCDLMAFTGVWKNVIAGAATELQIPLDGVFWDLSAMRCTHDASSIPTDTRLAHDRE